jgi:hypothetical protein
MVWLLVAIIGLIVAGGGVCRKACLRKGTREDASDEAQMSYDFCSRGRA